MSLTGPTHSRARLSLGFGLVCLMAGLAAFGPWIAGDPFAQDLLRTVEGPSRTYPLGTDGVGRDVLSRVIHGAPQSLGVATLCVGLSAGLGVMLGLMSAGGRRFVGVLTMRVADLMLAFPGILLALLLSGMLGGGTMPVMVGISLTLWPQFARMTHAIATGILLESHVEAARLAGFSATAIVRRHVLPSILPHVVTLGALSLGSAVVSISALGFLGLGLRPPVPEWGAMINEMMPYLSEAPIQVAAPCLAIFLSILGFTLLGEAFSDRMNRTSGLT